MKIARSYNAFSILELVIGMALSSILITLIYVVFLNLIHTTQSWYRETTNELLRDLQLSTLKREFSLGNDLSFKHDSLFITSKKFNALYSLSNTPQRVVNGIPESLINIRLESIEFASQNSYDTLNILLNDEIEVISMRKLSIAQLLERNHGNTNK